MEGPERSGKKGKKEGRVERKKERWEGGKERERDGRREGRSKLNTCLSGFGWGKLRARGISEGVCLCNRVKDRQSPVQASQRAESRAVRCLLRLSSR